jgi:hypothetical protein
LKIANKVRKTHAKCKGISIENWFLADPLNLTDSTKISIQSNNSLEHSHTIHGIVIPINSIV